MTISGPVPFIKKMWFFAGAESDAQRNVFAYGSSGSAIIHALVPTKAMRAGDFSQAALSAYFGNANLSNYGTLTPVPTVGDGSNLNNGNISPFWNPGADGHRQWTLCRCPLAP